MGSRAQGGTSGAVGERRAGAVPWSLRRAGRGGSGLRLGPVRGVERLDGVYLNGLCVPRVQVSAEEDSLSAGDARPDKAQFTPILPAHLAKGQWILTAL